MNEFATSLTQHATADFQWITPRASKFQEGSLFNMDRNKLAITNYDLSRWKALGQKWVEHAWTTRKKAQNNHAIGRSDETVRSLPERFTTAESITDVLKVLDETLLHIASVAEDPSVRPETKTRLRGAAGWICSELAAENVALGPCFPTTDQVWVRAGPRLSDRHPLYQLVQIARRGNETFSGGYWLANALRLPDTLLFGEDLVGAIIETNSFRSARHRAEAGKILRAMVESTKTKNPMWTPPEVDAKKRAATQRKKLTDKNLWWMTEPEHGDARFGVWRTDAQAWINTLPNNNLRDQTQALRAFASWNRKRENPLLKPGDVERHHIKRIAASEKNEECFFEWLNEHTTEARRRSRINKMREFFDWWLDNRAFDLNLEDKKNPFRETDIVGLKGNRTTGKSTKSVLPRMILERTKEVLRADDYAFARALRMCQARVLNPETGKYESRFSPVLPTVVDLLLEVPLRNLQAALLDSGEADEEIWDIDAKSWIKNDHPLAQKGRREGAIRKIANPLGSSITGLFINTNKTELKGDGNAERGYEIPWENQYILERLGSLSKWQRKFNAIWDPELHFRTRAQLSEPSRQIQGDVRNLKKHTYLFRAPGGTEPETYSRMSRFWNLLLQEVERQLRDDNIDVELVRRSGEDFKAIYTLHGLRVAGITSFVEAGVPLHIIAEFLSGHATLMMVLHYTVSSPENVHKIIEEAARVKAEFEDDMPSLLDQMRRQSQEDASSDDLLFHDFLGSKRAIEEMQVSSSDLWDIMPDGICPVGGSMCHVGATPLDFLDTAAGRNPLRETHYAPIQRDQYNCALCRFRVTGPAFLHGQIVIFNQLLFKIQQEARSKRELDEKMANLALEGVGRRRLFKLQSDAAAIDGRLEHLIRLLQTRMLEIQQSRALLDRKGSKSVEKHALITRMRAEEIDLAIQADSGPWDLLEFVAQTAEVFPSIAEREAPLKKFRLLSRMLKNNGLDDFLLELSETEALEAGNRLTRVLQDLIRLQCESDGRQEMRELMDCSTTLTELGVADKFTNIHRELRDNLAQPIHQLRLSDE